MNLECRICYEGDSEEKLIQPCKCSGTIGYIHPSCLRKTIHYNGSSICSICNSEYNIVETNLKKRVISFLLKSELITTIISILLLFVIINISYKLGIGSYCLVSCFFAIVFGINHIQNIFEHKEIELDFLMDLIYSYTESNTIYYSYTYFNLTYICIWSIINKLKEKLLIEYV